MRMYNSQFGMECLVDALKNTTLSEHPVSKPLLVGHFRDHAADWAAEECALPLQKQPAPWSSWSVILRAC